MVGAIGFEPTTSRSQTERSTRLSHAPITTCDIVGDKTNSGQCERKNTIGEVIELLDPQNLDRAIRGRIREVDFNCQPLEVFSDHPR